MTISETAQALADVLGLGENDRAVLVVDHANDNGSDLYIIAYPHDIHPVDALGMLAVGQRLIEINKADATPSPPPNDGADEEGDLENDTILTGDDITLS